MHTLTHSPLTQVVMTINEEDDSVKNDEDGGDGGDVKTRLVMAAPCSIMPQHCFGYGVPVLQQGPTSIPTQLLNTVKSLGPQDCPQARGRLHSAHSTSHWPSASWSIQLL